MNDLGILYHYRWGIEEAYKLLKIRVQLSNCSGKTSNAVKQDLFAKIFMMNMCAIMSFPIEEKLTRENQTSKTKPKIQDQQNQCTFHFKRVLGSTVVKKETQAGSACI